MTIALTLPLPPSRANARQHWRVALRSKKEYLAQLDMLLTAGVLTLPPRSPLVRAELHASLFVWSIFDTDNAVANLKPAIDWLVTRGYLASDKPAVLSYAGMPSQTIDRKRPRIELTLTPIPETR